MSQIPLLPYAPLVEANGQPNAQFQQFWQQAVQAITANITNIQDVLDQAIAAQNAAIAAQDAAIAAAADAATAQSTAESGVADASAALAVANSKMSQTQADLRYVRQTITSAWALATGTFARNTYATYTAPTISPVPTQAEVQAIADGLQIVSQHLAALIYDLKDNKTLT